MKYKTNFLTNVVLRYDFNPIEKFDEKLLRDFGTQLKNILSSPEIKELKQVTAKINQTGLLDQDVKIEVIGTFSGANNSCQVTLGPNFIFINVSQYVAFELFMQLVNNILIAFNEITKIDFLNRVGLRFINQINIPSSDPLNWNAYVHKSLYAPINNFFELDKKSISRSVGQTILNYDNYMVNFVYGIMNPDYPAKVYKNEFVLDYDCYALNINNKNVIENYIEEFHQKIEVLFEKSITNKLRKIMGASINNGHEN